MLVFHLLQKPYEHKCSDASVSHCLPLLFQFILSNCTVVLFFALYTFICVFVYVRMYKCAYTLSTTIACCRQRFFLTFRVNIYVLILFIRCWFYDLVLFIHMYCIPNCTPCTIVLIVKIVNFFVTFIRVFHSG